MNVCPCVITDTRECSTHLAGKALENGALIVAQNMNQPQRAAEMYQRASDLFMTAGKAEDTNSGLCKRLKGYVVYRKH